MSNAPLWQAEQSVDLALARQLIGEQFPELADVPIAPLGVGWDNTVFQVDRRYAFRFPRRAVAVPFLATEAALLGDLQAYLPLAIPVPRFPGEPSDRYPWPFLGYDLVAGTLLPRATPTESQRRALAKPLAAFLRALHCLPEAFARQRGVPDDTIERLNSQRRDAATRERLDVLLARGLISTDQPILAILADPPDWTPTATQLVHGDVHAGQLLVDDACRLVGVIDWGDVHVGDPGVDLAVAHALLPAAALEDFLAVYGDVPAARWQRARQRATWHGVALAAYAADIGDAPLLAEALGSLGRLCAVPL